MRTALNKYWDMRMDQTLSKYLPPCPSITYRRSKILSFLLIHSHYVDPQLPKMFGTTGPMWRFKFCVRCIVYANVEHPTTFFDSTGMREFKIRHTISCNTKWVVYLVSCLCNLKYASLTSREFKRRVREHVLGIVAASGEYDNIHLKTLPRHFKKFHNCDPSVLKVRGIDRVLLTSRGGGGGLDWLLSQKEAKWIYFLSRMTPSG